MKAKCTFLFSLLFTLGSTSVMAQEASTPNASDVHQAMFNAISAIEIAAALEPKASAAIAGMSDAGVELLYSSVANKEKFVESARQVVERIEFAKAAFPAEYLASQNRVSQAMSSTASTAAFPPNYPGISSLDYLVVLGLGMVDSPDDRCDGVALDIYKDVLDVAKGAMVVADATCSVSGCDPTGIWCAIDCAVVEIAGLAVRAAEIPLASCAAHGGNVDSAEIEAGYENITSTLSDLAAHDINIDGDLVAHDVRILARLDLLDAMMLNLLANQEEIIRLLKTPQGKRQGWNNRP